MPTIREQLLAEMQRRDWSFEQLAEACDPKLERSSVSRKLRADPRQPLKCDEAELIARALGYSLALVLLPANERAA